MTKYNNNNAFSTLLRVFLKNAAFTCRGNKFIAQGGELQVELSLRNRWGYAISDVYLEVSEEKEGTLLQGDIRHLFQEYSDLRAEFSDDEVLAMDDQVKCRVSTVICKQVIPKALALARRDRFLQQVGEGRFANSGVYVLAVARLKERDAASPD
jgi:hypothetical protein